MSRQSCQVSSVHVFDCLYVLGLVRSSVVTRVSCMVSCDTRELLQMFACVNCDVCVLSIVDTSSLYTRVRTAHGTAQGAQRKRGAQSSDGYHHSGSRLQHGLAR